MNEADWLWLIKLVAIFLKIALFVWLISLFSGNKDEKRKPPPQFRPEDLPPELAMLCPGESAARLWQGVSPLVSFDCAAVDGSARDEHIAMQVTAIWCSQSGKIMLQGIDDISRQPECLLADRIKSSLNVNGKFYTFNKFLLLLDNGYTHLLELVESFKGKGKAASHPLVTRLPAQTPRAAPVQTAKKKAAVRKPKPVAPDTSEFPRHNTQRERAEFLLRLKPGKDWRKEGILSLSGYRVGKARGRPQRIRRAILNTVVLDDDLSDIPDRIYAAQWGRPGTKGRYKKVIDSLKAFLAKGRKKNRSVDMRKAISDWEEDIAYVESQLRRLVR
ncbi:MAG: hypothetical protein LPJ97_07400 [Marinobacter sp.]|nr:hypothetical protein [Marinobacter sp.]